VPSKPNTSLHEEHTLTLHTHNPANTGVPTTSSDYIEQEQDWLVGLSSPDEPNQHPYVQVREILKHRIESGRYKFGEKLPSIRDLSVSFRLSHPTILRAVEQLISQGYIEAISGRGTFVRYTKTSFTATTDGAQADHDTNTHLLNSLSKLSKTTRVPPHSTTHFSPDAEHLPVSAWQQSLTKSIRNGNLGNPQMNESAGILPLREAISQYVRRSRGIFCSAEQVVITSGTRESLALIARTILDFGDTVAIENPSAPIIGECLRMNGADVKRVSINANGVSVPALRSAEPKLCIVSARNNPTGILLSAETSYDLLQWSAQENVFIVEDSFDNDLHFVGGASAPLATQRRSERVITMGSFAKTLHPLTTISYIVVPSWMSAAFQDAKRLLESGPSQMEQAALAEFIESGNLELHLRRTRKAYARKRALLISALSQQLRQQVRVAQTCSGLHQLVQFAPAIDNYSILNCAIKTGLPLSDTSAFYSETRNETDYIVSFAAMKDDEIFEIVTNFAKALAEK